MNLNEFLFLNNGIDRKFLRTFKENKGMFKIIKATFGPDQT